MASSDNRREGGADRFFQSLRGYVLSPLTAAPPIVQQEQRELSAEIDGYQAFQDRLATIEVSAATATHLQTPVSAGDSSPASPVEEIRRAYRETVMAVPHYDDVYEESLLEHVACEFGTEIANTLRTDQSVPLPPQYENALTTAASTSIRTRETILDMVDQELDSIMGAQNELRELVTGLSGTVVPDWYQDQFRDRLDTLAQKRQTRIQSYPSRSYYDGHTLCEYLYADEQATYPVLAGVARLREVTG